MALLPDSRVGKIEFFEVHAKPWSDNAAQIGLSAAETSQMANLTNGARVSYNTSVEARNTAKAATQTFYGDTSAMASYGAGLIAKIRAFAETTNNPVVYDLAQIPRPATPAPAPAPGKPTDFSVALTETGAVMLKWKCANPTGTMGTIYEVRRSIAGSARVFLGASGVKSFTDDTLPAGSTGVIYEVTAVRSTKRGLPTLVNVNFGVGGDGMVFARVESVGTVPVKMAA